MTADDPSVPNLRRLFVHKEGFPFSYPAQKTDIVSNTNDAVLWAAPFAGNEFVSIGSSGNVNRSIELTSEKSSTTSSTFSMEVELVATVGVVKVGGGYGYNNTNATTHTESVGHNIAGQVTGLNSIGDCPDFQWTVCWYNYKLGNQKFPVVYYVVKP